MTLYELTSDYLTLLEMAEDPDIDIQAFDDTLEGLEGEIEAKADGYAKVITTLNGDAALLKDEIDRLTTRKRTIEERVKRMKESLTKVMVLTGKTKFKTDLFSFNVQKNPAALCVPDESLVPDEYLIPQPPKVDKTGIKEAIKAGATFDWAYTTQSEGVRIR